MIVTFTSFAFGLFHGVFIVPFDTMFSPPAASPPTSYSTNPRQRCWMSRVDLQKPRGIGLVVALADFFMWQRQAQARGMLGVRTCQIKYWRHPPGRQDLTSPLD